MMELPPNYKHESKKMMVHSKPAAMLKANGKHLEDNRGKHSIQNRNKTIQRKIIIKKGSLKGVYTTFGGKGTNFLVRKTRSAFRNLHLRKGWVKFVRAKAFSKRRVSTAPTTRSYYVYLYKHYKGVPSSKGVTRPGFPDASYRLAKISHGIKTGKDETGYSLSGNDMALPHRFPYADIRNNTQSYVDGKETKADLERWSDRLLNATYERLKINSNILQHQGSPFLKEYDREVKLQITAFMLARLQLTMAKGIGTALTMTSYEVKEFIKNANSLHGNIPDIGPHSKVNSRVSDRIHLHFKSGRLTPGSKAAGAMTPKRSKGFAVTADGKHVVTTDGFLMDYSKLDPWDLQILDAQNKSTTLITTKDLPKGN